MSDLGKSKRKLDDLIEGSRVHLYKPIQIAEILYRHRTKLDSGIVPTELSTYRTLSKHWRDDVSLRLVGRKSTSSARFQDDLFNENAIPPETLKILADFNSGEEGNGVVERYIYSKLFERLSDVILVRNYLDEGFANPSGFDIEKMISLFEHTPGLRRSTDKIYEISVYGLFQTIVRALEVKITLAIHSVDENILQDFDDFVERVVGLSSKETVKTMNAEIYRAGVANAADRGLDMWGNFGTVVQVKHLSLSQKLAKDITETVSGDKIVIVCTDADKKVIETIFSQIGGDWMVRIQGIITLGDLKKWYDICLQKYADTLGMEILKILKNEFSAEFPGIDNIEPFMSERGYDSIPMPVDWK